MTPRRLAAILAADVVGYSRLMGEDEAGTAKLVRERREAATPIVRAFGGRVVKTTGDGVLLEFPSVVAAVECAIAFQKMMAERNLAAPEAKRILYRVGVTLGDILIDGDDILGDGVNLAARLEGICEPGAICLSEDAYRQAHGRIEAEFADLGEQSLKNIARAVRVYGLSVSAIAGAKAGVASAAPMLQKRRFRVAPLATALAALLVVIAGGAWWFLNANRPASVATKTPAEAARLSVVVLPFTNLSGDPGQDYLVDALSDELTTSLTRIRGTFVIAHNTAMTFKDKPIDASAIGKDLGVRYVLEGSVQPSGDRVRVNAQLIDAGSGAHIWAEQFDTPRADLLQTQDAIVTHLAHAMDLQLTEAEAARLKRTPAANSDAEDLALQCDADTRKVGWVGKEADAAYALCEQALGIDPNNVRALTALGAKFLVPASLGVSGDPKGDLERADGLASKALALDPDYASAHSTKGIILQFQGRAKEAVAEHQRALAIDPSNVFDAGMLAIDYQFLGEWDKSLDYLDKAILASPYDPGLAYWYGNKAEANFGLKRYDQAIDQARQAIAIKPNYNQVSHLLLVAALALTDHDTEAREALQRYLALPSTGPLKTIAAWKAHQTSLGGDPRFVEMNERVYDGLRKAGMPEDAPAEPTHLSIVVLPFTNLSNDPNQDYFADGITENLTTDLSRIKGSFVIARSTAFTYKGRNVDAKKIGKDLGVRYVLEGSVQRDQNHVRVNAQLVDAESGAHLWADRFEEDVADLFKLQDQVVARLGNALGFELVKAEAGKSARSNNPDAIDLAMRGWATMWRSYPEPPKEKRDSHYAALALFDQALKADPNDADALAGAAFTYMALFTFGETTAEKDLDAKIIDPADRAIALAPEDMRAYVAKSFYLAITGRASEALGAADSGLAIDPNSAPLLDARTLAEIVLGRFEQAKSDAQKAILLSPRDREIPSRLMNLGMAELGLGNYDAAAVEFQKAVDAGALSFIPYANLTAAYALAGKADEARSALAEARRLNPNLTVKWLTDHAPKLPPLFEGLRKAGLAEE